MFESLSDDTTSATIPTAGHGSAEHQPGRRFLSDRQTEAVERLVMAAAEEVADVAYRDITMRTVAKRAGVATATAYTYFSSKDHLLAEVLWRRMRLSPQLVDLSRPVPERVADTVRSMGFGTLESESPAAIAACTTALLGDGPDVKQVRSRIATEIAHRLSAALGPDADPALLPVLQITYTGAILSAGLGHLRFGAVPDLVAEAARLMVGDQS
jgi:AcrR family transcriptional regulator